MSYSADILILSNGPGEVTTWVRPVVQSLCEQLGSDRPNYRISLVLSPCPNASGKEVAIARRYPDIDRIQGADHFFPFLLFGKTAEPWDWCDRGVVVFLGGDQIYPILIGKQLGYRIIIYGEWDTRWHRWGDRYAVMNDTLMQNAPQQYVHKFTVIGDLMASVGEGLGSREQGLGSREQGLGSREQGLGSREQGVGSREQGLGSREQGEGDTQYSTYSPTYPPTHPPTHPSTHPPTHPSTHPPTHPSTHPPIHPSTHPPTHPSTHPPIHPSTSSPTIGFLPGSKPAKLAQGVPLCLAIAHHIHQQIPNARFVVPVAPTLELDTLVRFASGVSNPVLNSMGGLEGTLWVPEAGAMDEIESSTGSVPLLKIDGGGVLELHQDFPAYDLLRSCEICVTTVGANTAELGALGVPMLVLLPTQRLEAMKAWDGLPGLLANLPGVGDLFARLINRWFIRKKRLLAWPNIWAGEEIVPELMGNLQPQEVGDRVLHYLNHPDQLREMGDRLRGVRGQPGAADRLAQIVLAELSSIN